MYGIVASSEMYLMTCVTTAVLKFWNAWRMHKNAGSSSIHVRARVTPALSALTQGSSPSVATGGACPDHAYGTVLPLGARGSGVDLWP